MAKRRISRAQAIDKLYDLDIPDEELAELVMVDEALSTPMSPILKFDPDRVTDDGAEAELALGFLNNISRWRRKKKYKKRIKDWTGIRVVSEGDSWFQFPFILKDVIDHLSDLDQYQYAIYSLGAAGDLLKDISIKDEISEALERENPHLLLLSGGGNDMVGDARLASMVDTGAGSPDQPEDYLNSKFDEFQEEIADLYHDLFTRYLMEYPHLKIVTHGYDYAIPDKGKWLGDPLESAGINNRTTQAKIVKVMIDRFNETLDALSQQFEGSVFHVNTRKTVKKSRWHDELHPKSDAYKLVAAKFHKTMEKALGAESAAVRPRPPAQPTMRTVAAVEEVPTIADIRQIGPAEFDRLVYDRACEIMGDHVHKPESRHERRQLEKEIDLIFEKIHKEEDFLPSSFLEDGVDRAQSVCRVETPDSFGSGFMLVTRDYIMTNNHVLPNRHVAEDSIARFDYDHDDIEFEVGLDPDRLFITNVDLDYSIVALSAHDLPQMIRPIELLQEPAGVTRNERVNIIQHPKGRRKEISLHDNKVSYVYNKVIQYRADTEPGSSGSPVFNNQWQLVALHHKGWADEEGGAINQGVRMAAIVDSLTAEDDNEASSFLALMQETAGAAPPPPPPTHRVTGSGGRYGRRDRTGDGADLSLLISGRVGKVSIHID